MNEVVVEKAPLGQIVRLGVRFDGVPWTTYAADGLIVATPTGSTAYAFSARGPIVAPRHRAVLLTPVAPHMLFDRTLVLEPDTVIEVEVHGDRPAIVAVDGRPVGELRSGDLVRCQASADPGPAGDLRRPRLPRDPEGQVRPSGPLTVVLVELGVRNLGVVEATTIVLGPGLTALTGETGAGKTLLVQAVALLLGGRADGGVVGASGDEAEVEGRFVVDGVETTLRRVVPRDGRSRAYVDGRMSTAAELAERGAALVDLHGQHAHQTLLTTSEQRAALDRAADVDLAPLQRRPGAVGRPRAGPRCARGRRAGPGP